ncbi:DUF4221 family protein [Algoriphagus sp.]|uniref:DUF4221 family protein n=1 Tax=Algoriphagus sp. TaxID=1872435 RepID=UPI00391B875F
MKLKPVYLMILVLFSCGGEGENVEKKGTVLENFSYTVDTVVVNPGEEIINLSRGLGTAALSQDRKYIYQLDVANTKINQVNLDNMILEKQFPMEKEGPNGIGQYVFSMQFMDNGDLYMGGYNSNGLFNLQGEKVKDLNVKPEELAGLEKVESNLLTSGLKLTKNGKYMFSLPGDFLGETIDLAIIDVENKSGKLRKIPAMETALKYNLSFRTDNMIQYYGESITVNLIEDQVLITNSANNKIYNYNIEQDSLYLIDYNFTLTANEKDKPIIQKVTSEQAFKSEQEKAQMQIYFGNLLHDRENKRFFRFGRIWGPQVEEGQTRKGEFFIFVFDQELKLIGEAKLEGIKDIPYSAFFKAGKLWNYVNVDDELGFAVFDFKF